MLDNTGSHSEGIDLIVPNITLIVWLRWESTAFVWALFNHTGLQHLAVYQ